MPRAMVYALLILSLGLLLAGAIIGFAIGSLALGITCLIIFVVYCIVLGCMRQKIKLGIVIIKVAAKFLKERASVFITPLLKLILSFIFVAIWLYTLAAIM